MTEIAVRVMDCHVCRMVNDEPQFLLLKRANDRIYPGIWQCITGKISGGEKPWQTALRELDEETGLSPVKLWTLDRVNLYYEALHDRMNLIPVFGVMVNSEKVTLSPEHVDYRWCTAEEGEELLLWDQQKSGLRTFHSMLTGGDERLSLNRISLNR